MERCTCDEAPDLENRKAWQWGGCGDNLKYANKFVKDFLGKRSNKDLRARVDMHNTNVGMKVRTHHTVVKQEYLSIHLSMTKLSANTHKTLMFETKLHTLL